MLDSVLVGVDIASDTAEGDRMRAFKAASESVNCLVLLLNENMRISGQHETDGNDAHQFRLLSEREFQALTTKQEIEYLRRAIEAREALNRQIDASLALFRQKAE
jgi:hypothetical protein